MNQKFRFARGAQAKTAPTTSAPRRSSKPRFDAASMMDIGSRTSQQDALVMDFSAGDDIGIAVLADGMGGHSGGEIASNIAVSAAFADLKVKMIKCRTDPSLIQDALRSAVTRANTEIGDYAAQDSDLKGMGTTLVICVALGPDLYWASVGDSLLYVCRDGKFLRLNEDHSMVPQIEAMVISGLIDPAAGANHPQRNQLVSALYGGKIAKIDCPLDPWSLKTGDVIVIASDGVQTLDDNTIAGLVNAKRRARCEEITQSVVTSVINAQDPEQDNASVIVVRVNTDEALPLQQKSPASDGDKSPQESTAHRASSDDLEEASDLLNTAMLL